MYNFKRFTKDGFEFQDSVYRESWEDFYRVAGPEGDGPFLGIVSPVLPSYAAERIEKIYATADSWTTIRHPRLLSVHHGGSMFWSADRSTRYFLVTDWYEEGDLLRYRLEAGSLARKEALQVIADAATALHVLHEASRWHGRIALHSLLMDSEGRGRLCSPLESRLRAELDNVNSMGGSNWDFTFWAPEIVSGQSGGDIRSDLFSLIAVLYFLLTGNKPFTSNTAFDLDPELLAAVLPERPRVPAGEQALPNGLDLVLACGLHLAPDQRYQTPKSLLEDIAAVLGGKDPAHALAVVGSGPRWAGDPVATASETVLDAVEDEVADDGSADGLIGSRVRRSVSRGGYRDDGPHPRRQTGSGGARRPTAGPAGVRRRSRHDESDRNAPQSGERRRRWSSTKHEIDVPPGGLDGRRRSASGMPVWAIIAAVVVVGIAGVAFLVQVLRG